ncbi:exopolysaccharide biosynthesis polyprenyl glycosylphosphotransferase [Sphingomonas gellani]|uniref:Exopolysaccharide biosynthesis polyprenyl glycosylphosphotransferase n=1 Tax=Sphingomonas gellani TaxID=1166340 RepID=A0A1H8I9P2_9SPHN|nr:exopolysaccharide biosynthesis polyprenyl glycosylphosphotransferase [Sphingomonas gellani]SEN65520.1 exopolysaccharide biosynthesis polyprenyl glycosylphosphotransferase [Sphingomonas gellani]
MLLYGVLVLLDVLAVVGAFEAGSYVRYNDWNWHSSLDVVVVTLPIFILTAFNNGAYTIDALRRARTGIVRSAAALLFAFSVFLFMSYYFHLLRFEPRGATSIGMVGSFALVALLRLALNRLVVSPIGHQLTSDLVIMDDVAVKVPPDHQVIDTASTNLRPNIRDPMMLDRLARHLRRIDRVVVACKPERERDWAMLLKGAGINGEIISNEFDEVGAIGIGSFDGRSTLVVAAGPLSTRNRIIKRVFDLVFAVPALIILLPILLVTALAIKLDSRGPVFFRQQRVGRGNALFEVFKFRSMRAEQCDANGNVSASRDDDRITRVGRFIRATSIDELPQLLNVLFGSMSIVGPRPHALGSLAGQQLFWEVDERYWHRHALKPGITGLAQVRGFRGATHRRDDLTRRLQADLEYIVGWSVLRDVAILVSTIRVVVHRNAF